MFWCVGASAAIHAALSYFYASNRKNDMSNTLSTVTFKQAKSRTRRTPAGLVCRLAIAAAMSAVLAAPAYAGHGAVEYENPLRSAQEKRREQQGATEPAAPAPVVAPPASAPPPAIPQDTDADHAFALTVRRQLADVAASAESQLAGGKDGKLRALAERALQNARKEIAEIDRWLAAHP